MQLTLTDKLLLCFISLFIGVILAAYMTVDIPDTGTFTRQQARELRDLVARSKTKEEMGKSLYHPRTEADRVAAIADLFNAN